MDAFAYRLFQAFGEADSGLRKRQQRSLEVLMEMATHGLRNAGYQPPEEKELRHIIRLYARYARRGRQGHWTIRYLLHNRMSSTARFIWHTL